MNKLLCPKCFSTEVRWAERSPEGRRKCGACGYEGQHSEWRSSIQALDLILKEVGIRPYINPFYDSKNALEFSRIIHHIWDMQRQQHRADEAINIAVRQLLRFRDGELSPEVSKLADETLVKIQETYRGGKNVIQTTDDRNGSGEIRAVPETDGSYDSEIRGDSEEGP